MSCPNCTCPGCETERKRWAMSPTYAPWPYSPPAIPTTWQFPVAAPGYWNCGCGNQHPPGFVCTRFIGS